MACSRGKGLERPVPFHCLRVPPLRQAAPRQTASEKCPGGRLPQSQAVVLACSVLHPRHIVPNALADVFSKVQHPPAAARERFDVGKPVQC